MSSAKNNKKNYIIDIPYNTGITPSTDWQNDIMNIFRASPREIRDYLYKKDEKEEEKETGLLPTFRTLNLSEFSILPYYSDHLGFHIRDVILNVLKIVELVPYEFRVRDILILTTAAFLHDTPQFNPGETLNPREPKGVVCGIKELFKIFVNQWEDMYKNSKDNSFKNVFRQDHEFTKFGLSILSVAMYHPKDMPFDDDYKKTFNSLKGSIDSQREIYGITLEKYLSMEKFEEPEIDHIKLLAAVFQLADAFDIQQSRVTSVDNLFLRMKYMEMNQTEKRDYNKQLLHFLKDLAIEKVNIKEAENEGKNSGLDVSFILDKNLCKQINENHSADSRDSTKIGHLMERVKNDERLSCLLQESVYLDWGELLNTIEEEIKKDILIELELTKEVLSNHNITFKSMKIECLSDSSSSSSYREFLKINLS